jgi:hypothetical protein
MSDRDYQYRAVSNLETKQGQPLTVRFIRDMERNINNYKSRVGCHKLISDMWPADGEMTSFQATSGALPGSLQPTQEMVKMLFAPRYVPDGYSHMLVQSNTVRTAGSGTTIWRLRAVTALYRDDNSGYSLTTYPSPATTYSDANSIADIFFDATYFDALDTCTIATTNSGSDVRVNEIFECTVRDDLQRVWFILTSQNDDDTTFSRMWNLDVTPLTENLDV